MFVKGRSGNPGGRPKVVAEVKELAQQYTVAAIKTLADIARNAKEPAAARVSAASALLDRGYGKPAQMMTVSHRRAAAEMTDDELVNIACGSGDGAADETGGPPPLSGLH